MERDSSPSRHESHPETSHPKHVQFHRPSPSRDVPRKENTLDEQSPLLPARGSEDIGVGHVPDLPTVMSPGSSSPGETWNADTGRQEASRSSWYLLLLTISIGG